MKKLKGAAKRIFGGLQNRLSKLARFGQSKHEAKQTAREAYIKEHGNLEGYNPAKVDGIFSIGTMETYRATMQPFAEWLAAHKVKNAAQITKAHAAAYLLEREAKGLSSFPAGTSTAGTPTGGTPPRWSPPSAGPWDTTGWRSSFLTTTTRNSRPLITWKSLAYDKPPEFSGIFGKVVFSMLTVPIWEKANLTLEEAAAYYGIGINKLRALTDTDRCPLVLWVGSKRLIKRKSFEKYLEGLYSV